MEALLCTVFVRVFSFNYAELCGAMLSCRKGNVERAMGFEPTTSCLGSKHSTPELRPLSMTDCTIIDAKYPSALTSLVNP